MITLGLTRPGKRKGLDRSEVVVKADYEEEEREAEVGEEGKEEEEGGGVEELVGTPAVTFKSYNS